MALAVLVQGFARNPVLHDLGGGFHNTKHNLPRAASSLGAGQGSALWPHLTQPGLGSAPGKLRERAEFGLEMGTEGSPPGVGINQVPGAS